MPKRKRCSPRRKDVVNLCLEFMVVYLCVGSVCLEGRVARLERSLVLNKQKQETESESKYIGLHLWQRHGTLQQSQPEIQSLSYNTKPGRRPPATGTRRRTHLSIYQLIGQDWMVFGVIFLSLWCGGPEWECQWVGEVRLLLIRLTHTVKNARPLRLVGGHRRCCVRNVYMQVCVLAEH